MAEYPFDVRLGAFQGHSNQVVDPTVAHHQLTYDEAMSLGWIFHVTDYMNLDSIQQSGLKTFVKGSGKGRRDAVHFMYHNDNGQGYIRMAEGTKPPRSYRRSVYLVLDPSFIVDNQLYLTKNGVILFHGDIPFQYLHVKEQLPTIACKRCSSRTWPFSTSIGYRWFMAHQHNMEPCHEGERYNILFLDKTFLRKSESQHGSSWVSKFHKTMED